MNRSMPRPSRIAACSAKTSARWSAASEWASPSGPIEPGDEDLPARDLARLAGELDPGAVDPLELVLEEELRQLLPVRAERVGLDQVRACADEARVEGLDALRRLQVRLLGAAQTRDCARDEDAHPAVAYHDRARGEALFEPAAHAGSTLLRTALWLRSARRWLVKQAGQPGTRDRSTTPPPRYSGCIRQSAPMRRGQLSRKRFGPYAAGPYRCNCGSLTGDSGGTGRRSRLMFFQGRVNSSSLRGTCPGSDPGRGRKGHARGTVPRSWSKGTRPLCRSALVTLLPGADGNHPAARSLGRRASARRSRLNGRLLVDNAAFHAAGDRHHLACHVTRELVRSEHDHLARHVLRLGDLAQRHRPRHSIERFG